MPRPTDKVRLVQQAEKIQILSAQVKQLKAENRDLKKIAKFATKKRA
jgi:cell shape-determining protein MreC